MTPKTINRGFTLHWDTLKALNELATTAKMSASALADAFLREALGLPPLQHRKRGERDSITGGDASRKGEGK